MTEFKTISYEELKQFDSTILEDLCYIDPKNEECCFEAIDLVTSLDEIFENYYDANNITVESCANYFRKVHICKKNYAKIHPETVIYFIKDWFEDSEYNFDGEITDYLEGFQLIVDSIIEFNKAQTTYICDKEIYCIDLEEEFYKWLHREE